MRQLTVPIAQAITNIWLNGSPVASTLLLGALEIEKYRYNRQLEIRKAQRFFEACADEILAHCASFFDIEFKKIPQERRSVILEDIGKAFSKYSITKDLISSKFSPDVLYREILSQIEHRNTIPQGENDFIENTVRRISFYICEYVHLAPDFTPKTLKEMNANVQDIKEILTIILQKSTPISSTNGQFPQEELRYETRLQNVIQNIEVFGLSLSSIKSKYPLEASYISLSVGDDPFEKSDESRYSRVQVEKFIEPGKTHLLLGTAGSGKSTLMQWLCLQAVSENPDEKVAWLKNRTPIPIRLRSMKSFSGLSFFSALRQSYPNISKRSDEQWLAAAADDARAIFFIDGFDEVSPENRQEALLWIQSLVESFPDNTVIVTSRPLLFLQKMDFDQTAYLERMALNDVYNFINYWHNAVISGVSNLELVDKISVLGERIIALVRDVPQIRSLASNPLMCAILCAINVDRGGNIPVDRAEIYRMSIELMIERRNFERGIKNMIYESIQPKKKRLLLQEISRWLVLNGMSELPRVKYEKLVLDNIKMPDKEGVSNFLDAFTERCGLLIDIPPNEIIFVHNQFKEFLAAESFIIEDDIGLLERNFLDPSWRDLFPLACGLMNKGQAKRFISKLILTHKSSAVLNRDLAVQVVSLAHACPRLDADTMDQIEKIAIEVFPPQSADEVFQLLHLGGRVGSSG